MKLPPWRVRTVPRGELEKELNDATDCGYLVLDILHDDGESLFNSTPQSTMIAKIPSEEIDGTFLIEAVRDLLEDVAAMTCLLALHYPDKQDCGSCVSCRARVCLDELEKSEDDVETDEPYEQKVNIEDSQL